jgi:hypothetical protein
MLNSHKKGSVSQADNLCGFLFGLVMLSIVN